MKNLHIIVGRLGKDPELHSTRSGTPVCSFSAGTTHRKKKQDATDWEEETIWINCVAFGKQAEYIANYLKKGDLLYIEGFVKTDRWQAKDSTWRYSTKTYVQEVMKLVNRAASPQQKPRPKPQRQPGEEDVIESYDYDPPSETPQTPQSKVPF